MASYLHVSIGLFRGFLLLFLHHSHVSVLFSGLSPTISASSLKLWESRPPCQWYSCISGHLGIEFVEVLTFDQVLQFGVLYIVRRVFLSNFRWYEDLDDLKLEMWWKIRLFGTNFLWTYILTVLSGYGCASLFHMLYCDNYDFNDLYIYAQLFKMNKMGPRYVCYWYLFYCPNNRAVNKALSWRYLARLAKALQRDGFFFFFQKIPRVGLDKNFEGPSNLGLRQDNTMPGPPWLDLAL